jgi:hypothetical protein
MVCCADDAQKFEMKTRQQIVKEIERHCRRYKDSPMLNRISIFLLLMEYLQIMSIPYSNIDACVLSDFLDWIDESAQTLANLIRAKKQSEKSTSATGRCRSGQHAAHAARAHLV